MTTTTTAVLPTDTQINVESNANFPVAGLPGTPFTVQIDNEQMQVTSAGDTTISMPGASTTTIVPMLAADTLMTVNSNTGFPVLSLPATPFIVQVGAEQMQVTGAATTTLSQAGGILATDTTRP